MDTTEMTGTGIPSDLMAEMRQAAECAATGLRDPEVMRQACERMDRVSEQIRKRHGVLDIGTSSIRALHEAE